MISKKFFKSSFIYSVIGALPYVSGLILTLVFTAKITKEQIGICALLYSIFYLIQVFSIFSLEVFISVNYFEYKNNLKKLKEFVGTIMTSVIFLGLLISIISFITGPYIFELIFENILQTSEISFFPWGMITIFSAVLMGFFKVYSSLLIYQQRPIRFFWLNFINFFLTIVISIFLVFIYPQSLIGPMYGKLIPAVFSFITILILIINEYKLQFHSEYLKGIKAFCVPMVVSSLFIWTISYIDRYIIKYFLTDTALVGIFDIAVKCTLVLEFILIGLVSTIQPKIYSIWKDNNIKESTTEVNRYYNGLTAIILLIIPLFIIFTPYMIKLVIKNEVYYQIFNFFPILCLGFAFRVYFYLAISPIYFFKQTKVLPRFFLISAIFQIILNIFMIWYFGLIGAVWANFIIKPIQALLLFNESKKIFTFKINKVKLVYLPLIFTTMVIAAEFIFYRQYLVLKYSVIFIITLILVLKIYKNEILMLLNQFQNKLPFLKKLPFNQSAE